MADTRISQAGVRALVEYSTEETRISQAGARVLVSYSAEETRVSQAGVRALVGYVADSVAVSQAGVRVLCDWYPCLTHMAQCWKVTRTDGTVFAFTSADIEISYGGVTYSPCDSLSAGAVELGAELGSVGNGEIAGILSDDAISEADIAAGLFSNATVEVWMVPWGDTAETAWRLTKGIIGKIGHGRNGYQAEVLSPGALLQQKAMVELCTAGCRFELGDNRCTKDLGPLTVSGTVTGVGSILIAASADRRVFADSGRAEADGYFDYGLLTWLTGANAGAQAEVKDFVQATGQFTLWEPMNAPIAAGDTYSVEPGCDRSFSTCVAKFANGINYGGFKDVPGRDAMMKTPDAKQ